MADSKLSTYRAKRDFDKTAEPSGRGRAPKSRRLRFVVQKHDASRLHYDFRLELDGVLKSWAVTRGPSLNSSDKRLAVEVEDHPLDYGDFEGTIPQGEYGGGTVMLWDRGYWTPEGEKTPQQALADGDLKFTLEGERLRGSWVLVRMKRNWREGDKRTNWLLIKHRDESSVDGEGDAILAQDHSVASGRSLEAIAGGEEPGPAPFIVTSKRKAKPDAVWGTHAPDKPDRHPADGSAEQAKKGRGRSKTARRSKAAAP
jgi:bifunctional non-homologous end joining protein LigD